MAFYVSRRKLRPKEPDEMGELNIVPYLDILMNLIIFMLMSITGLAAFGVLNVSAPNYGGPSAAAGNNDKPQQLLSVLITPKGFFIAGSGAVLGNLTGGGEAAPAGAGAGEGEPTIPKLGDEYDYGRLTQLMVSVKQSPDFKDQTKIIIGADATVPYEALIQTMDAVRETKDRKQRLFSDVTLGAM